VFSDVLKHGYYEIVTTKLILMGSGGPILEIQCPGTNVRTDAKSLDVSTNGNIAKIQRNSAVTRLCLDRINPNIGAWPLYLPGGFIDMSFAGIANDSLQASLSMIRWLTPGRTSLRFGLTL
jgi:hypothetical protein